MNTNKFSPKEDQVKKSLKRLGHIVRSSGDEHQEMLRKQLQIQAESLRSEKGNSRKWSKWVFAPVIALATLTLFIATNRQVDEPTYYELAEGERGGVQISPGMVDVSDSASLSTTSTFYDRFLRNLGNNDVSLGDQMAYRDEYGNLLEQDLSAHILSSDEDIHREIDRLFALFDGYTTSINDTSSNVRIIQGNIPAQMKDLFIDELTELVKNEHFINTELDAQTRISDIVVIDEKIDEVTVAITDLESQIQNVKTDEERADLNQKLQDLKNYLEERERVKAEILNRVDLIDVTLKIERIPSWMQASEFDALEQSMLGFKNASLFQQLWLNTLFILLKMMQVLSYTFWFIIPLAIWLYRKWRLNTLFDGLD